MFHSNKNINYGKHINDGEDSDDDHKKRRKRHRNIEVDLPDRILVFENPDKVFHEEYIEGQKCIRFPLPFRACVIGQVNSGKSLIGTNILLMRQCSKPKFEEVYVVHGCQTSHEYDDIEPTEIMNEIPDYKEFDPVIPKLLIIDDYDFTNIDKNSLTKLSELFRFGSTHCNISIILLHQSWFRVPKIVKDMCNVFIIYKPHDDDELHTIGRRVGLSKDRVEKLFENIHHIKDSILINLIPKAPYKYALNLFTPIDPSTFM
jgi:hypothetical protein